MAAGSARIDASAARTTTGTGGTITVGDTAGRLTILVNVTASSGTSPNMVVGLDWSLDGTTWFAADPADAFTAVTTTGAVAKSFSVKGKFARTKWTITGTTPSFTFTTDALSTDV